MRSKDPVEIESEYRKMESRLADWAQARPDIRAVVVIGSRARSEHPADRWSDLDVILFVDDPAVFIQPGGWQHDLQQSLGLTVWFAAPDMLTEVSPEWEFVMEDGLKADLSFLPNQAPAGQRASLAEIIEHAPFHNVFARGMRPLVDKGPDPTLPVLPMRPVPVPDQAAFDALIANILLELTRAAQMSQRGELWRAARTLDQEVQENFLKLLEFHTRADRPGVNTWAYGRFLEEWADPRAVEALQGTFACSNWPSVRRALLGSLEMLAWLGPETAARLGLEYPSRAVEATGAWLRERAKA